MTQHRTNIYTRITDQIVAELLVRTRSAQVDRADRSVGMR